MATMQGGLVAVYATIAAQVFAVSAAFQFLKDAMETRNLIQSQKTFAEVSGTAYRTLTRDIQAATGGMLQFKEAAQAAAIGSAAGLSADQMSRLGNAAKNASFALGRDLTDSFNRLVRGVTKAEPELLDELGIILRLEPALKNYAVAIGKNVKELTLYEKSQAVANEVLDQAESKFAAIQKTLDPSAFALAQFGKAFDDLMKGVKETVGDVAAVVLPFFSQNVMALVGALTLFLIPVLKSILPDFVAMGAAAQDNYGKAARAADEATASAQRAKAALKASGGADIGAQLRDKDYMKEHGIKAGKGMPEGQLSARQLAIRKKNLEAEVGFSKNMNKKQLADYRRFLTDQEIALSASQGKKQAIYKRGELWFKAMNARRVAIWKKAQMQMVKVTQMASMAMNGAMRLMGWAGILVMIGSAVMEIYRWVKGVDEAAEAEKKLIQSSKDRYEELAEDIGNMNKLQAQGILNLVEQVEHQGKKMASGDIKKTVSDFNKILATDEGAEGRGDALLSKIKVIDQLYAATGRAEFKTLSDDMTKAIDSGEGLAFNLDKTSKAFNSSATQAYITAQAYTAASAASSKWSQTTTALNSALRNQMGSAGKLPMMDLVTSYTSAINEGKAITKGMGLAASDATNISQQKKTEATGLDDAITAAKASMDATDITKMDTKTLAMLGAGGIQGYTMAYGKAKEEYDALIKKQQDLNKESEDYAEQAIKFTEQAKKRKTEVEAYEAAETEINALQKLVKENKNAQLETDRKLSVLSTQNTTALAKNAKLSLQLEKSGEKLAKSKEQQKVAEINLAIANKKGNAEEIEAAQFAKDIADKIVKIEENKLEQQKEITRFQQLENTQKERLLKLEQKIAGNARQRALATNALSGARDFVGNIAGREAIDRALTEQKIAESKDKQLIIDQKRKDLEDYKKEQGFDPITAAAKEEEIAKLVNERYILEQNITFEKMKQAGLDKIAAEDLKTEQTQKRLTNMRGGRTGLIGSMGLGNITPQQVELNRLLAEHNTTAAEAAKETLPNGEKLLDVLKGQAVAAADFKTEMELTQSISNTLSNGFVSMFQAMIDGTQSFGDAMKGVMKQVLADLAAAYVKAAALKALQSFGLPLPGVRYGGVMSPSGKSFGYGGVATGPQSGYAAMLHGTEAVVPLGNDRSIPVEMRGGGSSNVVNVSVNISGSGQSSMTSNGGGNLEGMGRQIGALVQQHLQQEMRPGGILNSQGNRGR